jgi:hypothetical protein
MKREVGREERWDRVGREVGREQREGEEEINLFFVL